MSLLAQFPHTHIGLPLSDPMWQLLFEIFHLIHLVALSGATHSPRPEQDPDRQHAVSVCLLVVWYIATVVVWAQQKSTHELSVDSHGIPVSPAGTVTPHIVLLVANGLALLWCAAQIVVKAEPMGEMTFATVCEQTHGDDSH